MVDFLFVGSGRYVQRVTFLKEMIFLCNIFKSGGAPVNLVPCGLHLVK
jgi:hypothetical protein